MNFLRRGRKSEKGAPLVEYTVLMGLLSIAAINVVLDLGTEVRDTFSTVTEEVAIVKDPTTGGPGTPGTPVTPPTTPSSPPPSPPTPPTYTIDPFYEDACTNSWGYVEVSGDVIGDANIDNVFTFGFRRFLGGPPTPTRRLYFNTTGEQEYYGTFDGVDFANRWRYLATEIYPANWDPCTDDMGLTVPPAP